MLLNLRLPRASCSMINYHDAIFKPGLTVTYLPLSNDFFSVVDGTVLRFRCVYSIGNILQLLAKTLGTSCMHEQYIVPHTIEM